MNLARFHAPDRYLDLLETLTPARLPELATLLSGNVHFRDPFNDCHGQNAFLAVFADMLEQLDGFAFAVIDRPADPQPEQTVLVRWRLSARLPRLNGRVWTVTGCSALRFDHDGLLTEHVDYWDAASGLYELFPLVGPLMRWLRNRLRVRPE